MRKSVGGGASLSAHYDAVARATGKTVKPPELPTPLRYLWNHFAMLHRARGGNGFGPNPLSWSEINAYCQLNRTSLTSWELEALRLLDDAYLMSTVDTQTQE